MIKSLLALFFSKFRFQTLPFLLFFITIQAVNAQVTWLGNVNTDYFNVSNWSNTSVNFAAIDGTDIIINGSNPCVHKGGSANTTYRPKSLTVNAGAIFTVKGILYPNAADYLNGTITIDSSAADLNIRSATAAPNAYVGRDAAANITINSGKLSTRYALQLGYGNASGNAQVVVNGGSITSGTHLYIANVTTGAQAKLSITGGTVYVTNNLVIGTSGSLFISGLGLLQLTGDKQSVVNGYISSGKITCPEGKTLSVTYDGTNTKVAVNQTSKLMREYSDYVILDNGIVVAKLAKGSGNIMSLKVNGKELVATVNAANPTRIGAYYDFTTSKGFETIFGAAFSVKRDEDDIVDISFKRSYLPGSNVTPCDADIHYVLKKDDTGLYTYSILEHKSTYPAFDLGSWRQVLWIAPDPANSNNYLCEKIYADSLRRWQMPSLYDFSQASPTGIAEIVKLNTGVRAGKYDGKYEYSMPFWENPVWGHASDVNNIGTWFVNGSLEFFNEGPTYHDLNAAAGIIHSCMNGVHYDASGFNVADGEYWTKIYGPYLIYASEKSTGDDNWADAKARAATEKAQWPYSWLTNTTQYPLASQRGSISGKFIINDPFKPAVKGQNAWVGVTIISNPAKQWQFEEKNYQYWVKTDANGNFTIPNVRPGTYTFFGYSNGVIGDYSQADVVVTAGNTTALGDVTWNIQRNNGNLVWEIGYPNRKANEFKFGDFEYCEGFVQDKFRSAFPEIIEYDVASKDWANQLCYAHTGYPNTTGGLNSWKWRLNFTLPSGIPTTGNATLTIAYASTDHAQEWIYINGENSTFITYYPDNAGGNGFLRQTNYAKYSVKTISIPMNKLKTGANTITLLMPSTSSTVNHHMYDYISLEAPVVLPVSLVSYDAVAENGQSKLQWITALEKNNSRFEVERSTDGENYKVIAKVKGAGTTQQTQKYTVIDPDPVPGNNYYRLIQYDNDGVATELGIKVVKIVSLKTEDLTISPNPSEGVFKITVPGYSGPQLEVSIMDLSGRRIFNKLYTSPNSSITVDLGFKPQTGFYILKLNGEGINISKKLVFK